MSISALLRGGESRLRTVLSADEKTVGVRLAPGRPPPKMGQLYYAVSWGGGRGDDHNPQSSDILHGLTVTLTARLGFAPNDRRGKVVSDPAGLYDLADAIAGKDVIHGNWATITAANALIPGTAEYVAIHGGSASVNGFTETLVLLGFGPEREESPEWVGATSESDVYAIDVRFGEARRVQVLY